MATIGLRRLTAICAVLAIATAACGWQLILATKVDQPRKGAAISIVSQLNFRYDAAFIWSILTSGEGLQALTGFAIEQPDQEKTLTNVGDSWAASAGDNTGKIVVTTMGANRELRLVFEPEKAGFVIHKRLRVATAGNGCVIQYWSQYTDFESETDAKAAKEREMIIEAADAFRAVVESRVKPTQRSPHGS